MIDTHSIKASITDLAEEFVSRASEIEASRHIPADMAQKMASAGLFRLLSPRTLGGAELRARDFVTCLEDLSAHNAATGWCSMIASTAAISSAYMDSSAAQSIFGDPLVITGGVFAPMGKAEIQGDSFRVSGRWAWGSGSANCDWLSGGCTLWEKGEMLKHKDGRPQTRMVFFPASDVTFHDTWHVMGLRGTGSGDFEVSDICVPRSRSVDLTLDRPRETGPLYKFPVFGLLSLGIAGVAIGNARAALEDFKTHAQYSSRGRSSMSERAVIQYAVAELQAKLDSAKAYVISECEDTWQMATNKDEIAVDNKARLRLACTHAVRASVEICQRSYDLAGGSALFDTSLLQRRFRDAHAITQHIMTATGIYELTGRVLLGQDVNESML